MDGAAHKTSGVTANIRVMTENNQGLSGREREVLILIASGKTSRQIAPLLGIAFKTVVVHRQHLQKKLDLHRVADLTRAAIRMGLIEP